MLFAAAFVLLEFNAVEVNDRLYQSSSVMVTLTAGVVFAVGPGSATFGLATMAALGPLTLPDVQQRRIFQPMANFGQLTITGLVTGLVLDAMLGNIALTSDTALELRTYLPQILLAGTVAALANTLCNMGLVAAAVRMVYGRRDIIPWSGMPTIMGSHLFTGGILGGLLGAVMLIVSNAVIPIILVVYLLGHLAVVSYSKLREAHEATIKGFVKALEAKDLYTRGHTERVAYFAQLIGEELGFSGTQLERLRWAALIHDVGKLAVPSELIRKRGRLEEHEYHEMQRHAHMVEEILAEVDFLQPMVQIASGHHAHYDGNGYGGSGHKHGERPSLETCIIAAADAFDAMTSTRSYRMAMSQEFAFKEMRRNAGTQFDPTVVDALERALQQAGEVYGSPHIHDEETARALVEGGVEQNA